MSIQDFIKKFNFNPDKGGLVGVERECFIVNDQGIVVPESPQILSAVSNGIETNDYFEHHPTSIGPELSACQLEIKTPPVSLEYLEEVLSVQDHALTALLKRFNLSPSFCEVAPCSIPQIVYDDPRYQEITRHLPPEKFIAALRVIGTHIHVGMPDHETALSVYNRVILECDALAVLGDHSHGERLKLYKTVEQNAQPTPFSSWQDYYEHALAKGFADNPRNQWSLIRLSVHGTIEFRMFGATADLYEINEWARRCVKLCASA